MFKTENNVLNYRTMCNKMSPAKKDKMLNQIPNVTRYQKICLCSKFHQCQTHVRVIKQVTSPQCYHTPTNRTLSVERVQLPLLKVTVAPFQH